MNILTFDIEEWFHILDNESTKTEKEWHNYESRIHKNMDRIFELLDRNNQKATFFCLGWIAEKYPEIIKKIDRAGYEIGTHSHLHQLAHTQNRQSYANDLSKSIKILEDTISKKVTSYRAPGFSIKEQNKWAFECLIENGIEIDCSIFPAKRSHGGFASFEKAKPCIIECEGGSIKEFPINLHYTLGRPFIFSGGGYFRITPQWLLNYLWQNSDYIMTYFHPRDFDPQQPVIQELRLVRKFKSYYGLGSALEKLENLMGSHPFIDLQSAESMINWSEAQVVKL